MHDDLFDLFSRHGVAPLLLHTKTLIALIEADGTLLEWNPAFGKIKESLPKASHVRDLLTPAGQQRFAKLLQATAEKKVSAQASLEIVTRKNQHIYACLLIPIIDGHFLFVAEPTSKKQGEEVARLSRDLRSAKHELRVKQTGLESVLVQAQEIAHVDQLTFLSNQRKIVGDLQRKVIQSNSSRRPLTIFMLDIDRFKLINDTYGHIAGDHVLRTLSHRLRDSLRQTDVIGRYGGEEFLVLLPGTPLEHAIPTAERLLNMTRNLAIEVADQVVHATISIGIAQYQRGETWKECLERADKALYVAKNAGRDRWSVLPS
jgi:diguanylate cyclase (GGDEF)-like protein